MYTVAKKNSILVFILFSLFLNLSIISSDNKNMKGEKDIKLIANIVEPIVKIDQPIIIQLEFKSRKGIFRIYRHHKLGIATAANGLLKFKLLLSNGKELRKRYIDFDIHVFGAKYPYIGDYVDISPEKSYSETIKIYAGDRFCRSWPTDGLAKIKAFYSYKHNKNYKYGSDLWEGDIESNMVEVKITY